IDTIAARRRDDEIAITLAPQLVEVGCECCDSRAIVEYREITLLKAQHVLRPAAERRRELRRHRAPLRRPSGKIHDQRVALARHAERAGLERAEIDPVAARLEE